MDSDEDMYDAYSSEGPMQSDDEYEDLSTPFDDSLTEPLIISYTVLSEDEIRSRQDEAVRDVVNVLSIPSADASMLLRHFKWRASTVNEVWFANEQGVRKDVGLVERFPGRRPLMSELLCGICLDSCGLKDMRTAACGCHYFCSACWTGYIHTAITDGPGCLTLRCPDPKCRAAVGDELVLKLVSDEDRSKYSRYLLRSFVEQNKSLAKWCPAAGCEYAIEYIPGGSSYNIGCKCGNSFCWNCLEDAHRPVDCETVRKWILKNSAEAENTNWILVNSKPCPKCNRPIEKNMGCMHMTCSSPCRFQFCWLCLGDWTEHGERTGGFFACNRFEAAKQQGLFDEAERRREMAKCMLEKYTHYYERWATNESSRAKALRDLGQMQGAQLERLSNKHCQPVTQLKFITDAWMQIVDCRRVLKWTYAYGYYLEEDGAKKQFFEYLQGEAEYGLERLHKCAEKDLDAYFHEESVEMPFNEFRTKLTGLTRVTKTYFENLVRALENGLKDVNSRTVKDESKEVKSSSSINESGYWSCERCTVANPDSSEVCEVCFGVEQ